MARKKIVSRENCKEKTIYFNMDDPLQKKAYDFLSSSVGRKQSLLMTYAIHDFVDKYHLQGKTVKDIQAFLHNFEVISASINGAILPFPSQYGLSTLDSPNPKEKLPEEDTEKDLASELNDIAAMFGA